MRVSASSAASIFGFVANCVLNFGLAMRASPAHTTRATRSPTAKERVFAIRADSHPTAAAASSTVALDVSNSITASALPNFARCSFAFSSDMISPSSCALRASSIAHARFDRN
jgi:hypothetical protein